MTRPSTFQTLPFQPLIIIGAGRSGTNVLRDTLVRLDGFATWPCDEINPIWRHGNLNHPDDAIPEGSATPAVKKFIRRAFLRIWDEQSRPKFVVEKTCANALRVPFVNAVLPEARFIHIVRDGYDIIPSARKRWNGELEVAGLPYFLAKARYAPVLDLHRYAISAIRSRLMVRLGLRSHLKSWGPKFSGMDRFSGVPIDELIARQWAACVTESQNAFSKMSPEQVFEITYEDFVANAESSIEQIMAWLGETAHKADIKHAASLVRTGSVGIGRRARQDFSQTIQHIMQPPMKAYGYLE